MKSRYGNLIIAILLIFFVNGCAHKYGSHIDRSYSESLREAVKNYWTLRVKGDYLKAYNYEHVAYMKKVTIQYYLNNFDKGVDYKDFEILKIEKEGSGPNGFTPVWLRVKFSAKGLLFPVPKVLEQKRREYWVKEKDGRWYHILSVFGKFY